MSPNDMLLPMPISERIPRAALVTGGAKRLGRGIAVALARAGFAVAIHYRNSRAEAEGLVAELRARDVHAACIRADLSAEADVQHLVARVAEAIGPLGVLVNNASSFERDQWESVTRESWDLHMEANLRAPFVLTQRFAQALPPEAQGVVINMLDPRVWAPNGHLVSYALSKSGLWALTQSLALALAPRVRVNGIGPGPTLPSVHETTEAFARDVRSLPLRRSTSPEEIGWAILAILSLPSLTGQMLALDGGQHLARTALALDTATPMA
jgi:NAD(P)-dependent dehydrogenase (short-subunit alcohol dehydrogenase family)